MQIKILLVEDQKLMRIGIKSLFCDYPELEIIGEAVNGKEAIEKARLIKLILCLWILDFLIFPA